MKRLIAFMVLLLCSLSSGFIGNNIFQTGDPNLFDPFCITTSEDFLEIGEKTITHETITIQALKKSITTLFQELNPDYESLDLEKATLSEVFQSYFGANASPDRFLDAAFSIISSLVELDNLPGLKDDPTLHFDNEEFEEASRLIRQRNNQINAVTGDGKYATARELLGKNLHSIQKFYAHSNWVELDNSKPFDFINGVLDNIADPTEDTCNGSVLITTKLTSGYWVMFIN